MWSRFRFFLLPAFGAAAAILAFQLAGPFEGTLDRPGLSLMDPEAQFTFGTRWGDVNRLAFGALLCGLFCFGLSVGRRTLAQLIVATLLGASLGAAINFVTDSLSDVIGLHIAKSAGMLGNLVSSAAWCVLVPAGVSLTLLLALGPTPQRLRRALVGTVWAGIASAAAQMAGMMVGGRHLVQDVAGGASLQAFIPVWRDQEIAVGIALGLAMAYADIRLRVGTLRLELGKNEWRDWSLDHQVSRIGSGEGIEVPLGPIPGVEKIHVLIVRQDNRFILDTEGRAALVNGQPATQCDLKNQDQIQLGSATLRLFTEDRLVDPIAHAIPATQPYGHGVASIPTPVTYPGVPGAAFVVLVDAAGGQFHLPLGQFGVGREGDNVICLSGEASVSRYHARIAVTVGGTLVADNGSTNGTYVNGARVAGDTLLRPGDTVQFGNVRFRVDRVPVAMS